MNDKQQSDTNRGQAFTLEAFFASIIILSAVSFALTSTVITPLSSSTSSKEVQNTEGASAEAFLQASERDGSLKRAVLAWDAESPACWVNSSAPALCLGYGDKDRVPGEFGDRLRTQFGSQTAANVELIYRTPDGDTDTRPLINQGTPSENAQSAETQIVLYDKDSLYDELDSDGRLERSGGLLYEQTPGAYYATDIDENSDIRNVVIVRVTVWRI